MINTQLTGDQNSDHVTTKVDIPAPSGRGEESDGTAEMIQTMHDLHSWAIEEIQAQEAERQRLVKANKIDRYFASRGSPMNGLGIYFVRSAERYAINPYLAPAISESESSCGLVCFAPFNFWGGLAYRSGFGSWEESIDTLLNWLNRYFGSPQSAWDCPGYCVPSDPWRSNTQGVLDAIERIEI